MKIVEFTHSNSIGYGAAETAKQVSYGLTKSSLILFRDPQQA